MWRSYGYSTNLYNHPASSTRLKELARTTMWDFADLLQLKTDFNLTDHGVETIISYCAPIGVSPYAYLDAVQQLSGGRTLDYSLLK